MTESLQPAVYHRRGMFVFWMFAALPFVNYTSHIVKTCIRTNFKSYPRWAAVDWSWHKEWNKCAWADLFFPQKKVQEGNNWSNILPNSSQARNRPPPCTKLYWPHQPCGCLTWLKMWCHQLCLKKMKKEKRIPKQSKPHKAKVTVTFLKEQNTSRLWPISPTVPTWLHVTLGCSPSSTYSWLGGNFSAFTSEPRKGSKFRVPCVVSIRRVELCVRSEGEFFEGMRMLKMNRAATSSVTDLETSLNEQPTYLKSNLSRETVSADLWISIAIIRHTPSLFKIFS